METHASCPVMSRLFPTENLSLKTPQATFLRKSGLARAQSSYSPSHPYRITARELND